MIGGFDLALHGATSPRDIDLMLRAARAMWPSGILESGDGHLTIPLRRALSQTWTVPCEIFVYETRSSYESWTDHGLTDDNADQMISITIESEGVFFVVNTEGSKTFRFAKELIDSLKQNRWAALKVKQIAA